MGYVVEGRTSTPLIAATCGHPQVEKPKNQPPFKRNIGGLWCRQKHLLVERCGGAALRRYGWTVLFIRCWFVSVQLELGHVAASNTLPMSASTPGQCACPHCVRASTSTAVMDRMMYRHSAVPPPAAADDDSQVSTTTTTTTTTTITTTTTTTAAAAAGGALYKRHGTSDSARPYVIRHSVDNGCSRQNTSSPWSTCCQSVGISVKTGRLSSQRIPPPRRANRNRGVITYQNFIDSFLRFRVYMFYKLHEIRRQLSRVVLRCCSVSA